MGEALVVQEHAGIQLQGGTLSAAQIKDRVQLIQRVMHSVMKPDVHYGTIPGTDKKSLLQPGADLLGMTFQIAPSYIVEDLGGPDEVRYAMVCIGTHQQTGVKLGEGVGECSSMEEKYKWRRSKNKEWDNTPEERRRIKYGYNSANRQEYEIKQVRTEPVDVANTIRKMAAKRAKNGMIITVLAASDMFSQEVEDLPEGLIDTEHQPVQQPKPKAKPEKKPEPAQPGAINETQAKMIRKKLEKSGKDEAGFCEHFGIEAVEDLPMAKINDALAWAEGGE